MYGTELAPLAAAVYTTPSFINHSCVPNCVVVYTGRKLSLRTVQEVKAGDQLFISYTEQLEIYAARKTELERMYGFQCTCQRCRDDQAMSPVSDIGLCIDGCLTTCYNGYVINQLCPTSS